MSILYIFHYRKIFINIVSYFQTDIDDLKRQNGILDQQGMALVFAKVSECT